MKQSLIIFFTCLFSVYACREEKKEPLLFQVMPATETGLTFANRLTPTKEVNMLQYMYFYNGAGVGAGDFNNDGKIDLYFAGNQVGDRLYLNDGSMRFRDVSQQARIPDEKGWSTGVSVVDINNDGRLDIYVCRVGNYATLQSHNLLLVCTGIGPDGIPTYADSAAAYGLDFSGFSTQAAFFDLEGDGDLDMYLMNHSLRYNSTFNERSYYRDTYDTLSGDRLYRNDAGRFRDITKTAGINSSVIGYGLGLCVSDIDLDGYPDLYVANDFHENDYLYINQRNGSFRDAGRERLMHTSQFSMGVDISDINGDAYPEIITLDMLPEDPYILRRSLGEDEYNLFQMKLQYGYQHQYTRNNLQLNRGNGMFSEVGLYAGIAATDWSWSPLWMDFDNDGRRDLFISNGIPKRLNDIDYVNYISGADIQSRIRSGEMGSTELGFIEKFPQIRLRNKFFHNRGDVQFADMESAIGNDRETYSNGAVYADLDNDGDLDIVVNNIDDEAMLYRNNSDRNNQIRIDMKGPGSNLRALGARVMVYTDRGMQTYEKYPVRGFQSSMEVPLIVGVDSARVDSVLVVWPDRTYERIDTVRAGKVIQAAYRKGLPVFSFDRLRQPDLSPVFEDITPASGLDYRHEENVFVEFNREPLIPFMVSTEGPALAIGDMNKDGLEDVYLGASKGFGSALYLQEPTGKFRKTPQPALAADSVYEDVDACWTDVNADGFPDLVVASGGNEFYGNDEHLLPRLYINEGGKALRRKTDAFADMNMTLSTVLPGDFNNDGYPDLFFGGRAVPFAYGAVPQSYLLLNDGKGNFKEATERLAPGLSKIGHVRDAVLADLDGDKDDDLVLALEWGGIQAYMRENQGFVRKVLSPAKGWWSLIRPVDLDNDGDLDLVVGNLGENSRLKASPEQPVRLYINDFDDNGTRDQVLSYYLKGREIPFANKAELEKQMPFLRKKFLYAEDFAKATLQDVFGKNKLTDAQVLSADYFQHAVLINEGAGRFSLQALPPAVQYAPLRAAVPMDYNGDRLTDLLLFGNFYPNTIQLGRQDADFGTLLLNRAAGGFQAYPLPGLVMKGEVRQAALLKGERLRLLLARNNDSVRLISTRDNRP